MFCVLADGPNLLVFCLTDIQKGAIIPSTERKKSAAGVTSGSSATH